MALTTYTTYDSVRAALGVSSIELPDATLSDSLFESDMLEQLHALHPDLAEDFATARAVGADPAPRFVRVTEMLCAYLVAEHASATLPMFAPVTVKDARSELTRAEDPYTALARNIAGKAALLRTKVREAYADVNPAAPAPTVGRPRMLGVVSLGTNPVTG